MQVSGQERTSGESDAARAAHDCPLCSRTEATRSDVYGHLLVEHRKSAITAELVGHERPDDGASGDGSAGGATRVRSND